MLVECLIIFGLIASIIIMSLRMNKKDAAIETIPFLVLPFMNIISSYTSEFWARHLPLDTFTTFAALNIFASFVSCLLTGIFLNRMKKKRTRAMYIAMSLIYNVALSAIFIYNMYSQLNMR